MPPKRKSLEALLEELAALRDRPVDESTTELLSTALRGRSSHGAAKAAALAAELAVDGVADELCASFDRFMIKAVQSDPGCAAKEAIVDALQQMGIAAGEVYSRGIVYRQMEPVWGGRVDTAARLRGLCGIGLARIRDPNTVSSLAVLLADSEAEARRVAAQALAYNGDHAAVPLLRFKALVGDEDSEVLTEVMRALLELSPSDSVPFVASFLEQRQGRVAEVAALALGGSRVEEAFAILREWWGRAAEPSLRASAALGLAMLRREHATDFLIDILSTESVFDARHAIVALAIYRHDERLRDRVEKVVDARDEVSLHKEFDRSFSTG